MGTIEHYEQHRSSSGAAAESQKGNVAMIVSDVSNSKMSRTGTGSITDADSPSAAEDDDSEFATLSECVQAAALFDKFVAESAYFCINISWDARKKLSEFFGANADDANSLKVESMVHHLQDSKVTRESMWRIFVESRESIFLLLLQSLGRFVLTESYPKLERSMSQSGPSALRRAA